MIRVPRLSIYPAVAALALSATLCLAQTATRTATQTATVSIQLDKPAHAVSPRLYGLMTEEINYSYDGGLYAELVRNRTFQDHGFGGVAHWNIEHLGNAQATMKIDSSTGPSEALQHSLLIEVGQADAANQAGVRNEGYWGMAMRPKTTYKGSLYAKTDVDLGPLTASLVDDRTNKTLATATVPGIGKDWAKHEFTLTTGAIEPTAQAHLLLTVGHAGKLWIDMVSLFPPTYKNRENGNRPDIMEKMAEMHPKFLRLPGGNYLEGQLIDERFDWKTTLGPLVDRPTHPSPWNYQSSDGMGLLEFLEWTEDLKIDTVLAVYAGYSLKGDHIHPGPQLVPFVDDALEEIEFVTGDVSTKWGAVRAKLGHPAPFPVKYIEIGNEDWFDRSGSYEARYKQFYKAIKAKYPTQFELIATAPLKNFKPDVLDDHYYKRADEFFDDVKHYDTVDRNGPKIFVGEWATREGGPTTNFGAALGDAAWMTGMERNSDLIVMASYAPLFVNVNPGGMQWESNLIGYDAMTSYGAPSFYAQSMFAEYLGTQVPTSTSTGGGARFFYSVTSDAATGKVYLKLVNANSTPETVEVKLEGAASVAKEAKLISLTGAGLAATNTLTDPTRIVPSKASEKIAGASFTHTMPGYSIQVLELSAK